MPEPTVPSGAVELTLADGRRLHVNEVIADRVRGVDADGDLLIPLGEPNRPMCHDDGAEYLIPLTPCCHADGKGNAESSTGVVCRSCYRDVDSKYGRPSDLAARIAGT